MHLLSRNKTLTTTNYHLFAFISVVVLGYLTSFVFFAQIWTDYNHLLHSTIEIFAISLMLFSFLHVWNTYLEANHFVRWVGLGTLIIVVLNLPHVVNLADLINMPEKAASFLMDISLKCVVASAYIEIIIWLLLYFYRKGFTVNKWVGLALSLSVAALFCLLFIKLIDHIPAFYSKLNITVLKHYADLVLSLLATIVLAAHLVKFRGIVDDREKVMHEYIILALCFFIPSRICFALSWDVEGSMQFWGHIFKLAYYYSIYYGVYKTTIEYPYNQVRKVKDFYERFLDNSPFGLIAFDIEGKISYSNLQCDILFKYDTRKLYGATTEQLLNSIVLCDYSKSDLMEKLQTLHEESTIFYAFPPSACDSASKLIISVVKQEMGNVFLVRNAKREQTIENMRLQTQTLIDAMDNVVLLLDINGKVVMCNKNYLEITNTKTSDVMGINIMELSQQLQANSDKGIKINSNNDKIIESTKWNIKILNGNIKKIRVESSPIYDVDNEKIGWVITGRDISEYEKEQEKIIHSEKMAVIGQMAAGLVHEIKNPLASIKGLCQLMLSRAKPEKITEYATVMERAVDDIGDIVTGFLQFSKPTSGKFEEEHINSLVNSLEMMISTNAYKYGIKTYFYYSSTEEPVMVSSQQIKNAILGMVDNSLDAMNGAIDPKLIISTEHNRNSNMMSVSIKDNGIGMTDEQLACIGTPFYTTKPKGTGLGVSVIKYIVNDHKGTLNIESSFGEGALFTINLPCKTVK